MLLVPDPQTFVKISNIVSSSISFIRCTRCFQELFELNLQSFFGLNVPQKSSFLHYSFSSIVRMELFTNTLVSRKNPLTSTNNLWKTFIRLCYITKWYSAASLLATIFLELPHCIVGLAWLALQSNFLNDISKDCHLLHLAITHIRYRRYHVNHHNYWKL